MTKQQLGVFICQCGGNISDYVDTEKLRETIAKEALVATTQVNMFTCSDASQQDMIKELQRMKEQGLYKDGDNLIEKGTTDAGFRQALNQARDNILKKEEAGDLRDRSRAPRCQPRRTSAAVEETRWLR